ncbi:Vegetative incompatibility protein HET-E-1 [Ceratobasidium sp. AG-Ba]|nr:Vegetative incompatibility protein HET-E-1 [Ceratobasidium sp. AG-Ba]
MITGPLEGHTAPVKSIVFSPDATRIASCSDDGTVCLWSIEHIDVSKAYTRLIHSARFSSDGSHLVTGGGDCCIYLWDLNTGNLAVGPLIGHTGSVYSVDISPDKLHIASVSDDRTVRLWDIKGIRYTHKVLEDNVGVYGLPWLYRDDVLEQGWVRFSPDGSRLVFGSKDKDCRVYSVRSSLGSTYANSGSFTEVVGACDIQKLEGQPTYLISCYLPGMRSADGGIHDIAYFNDKNRGMRHPSMWVKINEPSMMWYTGGLYSVSLSPDKIYAASGSDDGKIQLWDAQSGQPLNMAPLEGHMSGVRLIQFSPDGSRLVSCSDDNTVRLWNFPDSKALEAYKLTGKLLNTSVLLAPADESLN